MGRDVAWAGNSQPDRNATAEGDRRYRRLIEAVTDYIFTVRVECGRPAHTTHGPNCIAVTGYTPEEFAANGLLWITMVPEEDRPVVEQQVRRILAGDDAPPIEHRIRRKDGAERWVMNACVPLRDAGGTLVSYDGLVRDITERKQAEQALRQLNETLEERVAERTAELEAVNRTLRQTQFTIDHSQDAVFWIKPDGAVFFVNDAACQLTGYPCDELLGLRVPDFDPEMCQAEWTELWMRARSDRSLLVERRCMTRDKQFVPVEVSCRVFQFSDEAFMCALVRDVSSRKRAERETLRQIQIYEHVHDIVFAADMQAVVTMWNKAAEKALGYTSEEAVGQPISFLYFEEDLPLLDSQVISPLIQKGSHVTELRSRRKNGEEIWLDLRLTSLRDATGAPVGIVGCASDITERKQIHEELRASERRFRQLFDASPLPLWEEDWSGAKAEIDALRVAGVTDLRAHLRQHPDVLAQCLSRVALRSTNLASVELFEADSRSQILKNLDKLIAEESFDVIADLLGALAEGQSRFQGEEFLNTLGGAKRHVIFDFVVMPGYEQSWSHCLVGLTDITKRKQAETALRASEQRLRAILNTAADAVITIDRRGIIEGVNPATERMFGYAESELVGKNVRVLMPDPYSTEHDTYIARYLAGGAAKIIGIGREVVACRRDGSTFPIDLAVSEVKELGLFTGVLRDLTDRKALQRQVLDIAAQEQTRIGQDLHDGVGQELTGLNYMTQNLLAALPDKTQPVGQLAQRISAGLRETQHRLREVAQGLMPVMVDSEGLRAALEDLAGRVNAAQNMSCHFACREDVHVPDNSTAMHLYRIAQEAVNNALKHSRGSRIDVSLSADDGRVILEVADDGIGKDATLRESDSMGLEIMHYRASLISARLHIDRREEGGTVVQCELTFAS